MTRWDIKRLAATVAEETNKGDAEGLVLEIQRFSTDDGPGIRTTVFMKGCPLTCRWCHNPESISIKPQVQWLKIGCLLCGECVAVCPNSCLTISEEKGVAIDRSKCAGCGACVDACPSTAMDLFGKRWSASALAKELEKDEAYFAKSDGGITISGGEVTMQLRFVVELLSLLKARGIHTAIDTCGFCSQAALDAILPHIDLVLFDLKVMDCDKHKEMTGQGNETILERARYLATLALGGALTMWVRTPIIPGAADSEENIHAIGAFIAEEMRGAPCRWELCAFNNLCRDKYERLGIKWEYANEPLMSEARLMALSQAARNSGVDPDIVHWGGPMKRE